VVAVTTLNVMTRTLGALGSSGCFIRLMISAAMGCLELWVAGCPIAEKREKSTQKDWHRGHRDATKHQLSNCPKISALSPGLDSTDPLASGAIATFSP
jgi:hypothetical protein